MIGIVFHEGKAKETMTGGGARVCNVGWVNPRQIRNFFEMLEKHRIPDITPKTIVSRINVVYKMGFILLNVPTKQV